MVTKERIEELRTKAKEELAYKKAHRNELLIKRLEEMVPFDDECIPSPPIVDKETYDKYVIPNFIRCGAIPSSDRHRISFVLSYPLSARKYRHLSNFSFCPFFRFRIMFSNSFTSLFEAFVTRKSTGSS